MITDQERILIEKYFFGTLSPEEQETFNQLRERPSFAKEVQLEKEVMEVVDWEMEKQLKRKLIFEEAQLQPTSLASPPLSTPTVFNSWKTWAIAASVVLLITFSGLRYFWQPHAPENLYSEYFQPYPNVVEPINRTGNGNETNRYKAFLSYENKQYDQALNQILSLPEAASDPDLLFYQAQILLIQENYQAGQPLLESLINMEGHSWYKQASWYLALTYIGQNKQEEAITLLQFLERDNTVPSYKKEAAKELLTKIQSP